MSEPTQQPTTMPRDSAEMARARQIERDNLDDLLNAAEAEHGPITEDEIRAKRELLRRARAEQSAAT